MMNQMNLYFLIQNIGFFIGCFAVGIVTLYYLIIYIWSYFIEREEKKNGRK
jgi:hypothetical protein